MSRIGIGGSKPPNRWNIMTEKMDLDSAETEGFQKWRCSLGFAFSCFARIRLRRFGSLASISSTALLRGLGGLEVGADL